MGSTAMRLYMKYFLSAFLNSQIYIWFIFQLGDKYVNDK